MNYVIGDVHGEINKLKRLIYFIRKLDDKPKFIFIGDYIDKGFNSKETLDYLVDFNKEFECVFLIGNHEFYWMEESREIDEYLLKYGGKQTIKSFKSSSINETRFLLNNDYKDFFKSLIPYYIFNNYFISHSGFNPLNSSVNINEIPIEDFLFNRYDFIKTNHFFKEKYKVIFGHTGFYSPYVDKYKIGIDTGACFLEEQPLTAFCLEKEFFLNSKGKLTNLLNITNTMCPSIIRSKPWQEN